MSEQQALNRANKVYTNYHQAKDNVFSNWGARFRSLLKSCGLPAGVSNCTLSATQWIDPNNPIMRAQTIYDNPEAHSYTFIEAKDAIPGNLLITRNPETGGFHSMMIEGFDQNNEPILRYSSGGHDESDLRKGIPLNVYHQRDNAQGGNHTQDLYYRYNYPNSYWLPEITVTASKQLSGGTIKIKKKNVGAFTRYCNGTVTEECIRKGKNSSNPTTRKRANFAWVARHKFKHEDGGTVNYLDYFQK